MTEIHRLPCRLLMAAMVLAIVGTGRIARAQDDEDEPAVVAPVQQFVMADENFDQWIFGARNAATGRSRLDSLLALQIEDVDRTCGLTESQKKKLLLAGRGDLKRFFDRIEDKRKKFQLVKNDQNKVNEVIQEIQPLQLTLNSGPFGEGSIFFKTLEKTLDEEQVAKYDAVLREKRLFRYRAKVELVVAVLDDALGLSAEQRRRFIKLLLEDTHPPRRYGQYDYYVVMVQAAKLPEAKLRPIFDDAQWKLLGQQLMQMKGMEEFLKKGEFLPEPAAVEARERRVIREVKKNE
jgi:hypothetical protein